MLHPNLCWDIDFCYLTVYAALHLVKEVRYIVIYRALNTHLLNECWKKGRTHKVCGDYKVRLLLVVPLLEVIIASGIIFEPQ